MNVLVYTLDADAPQHEAARALLEAGREASTTLFVTAQILCGVLFHRDQFPKPATGARWTG